MMIVKKMKVYNLKDLLVVSLKTTLLLTPDERNPYPLF